MQIENYLINHQPIIYKTFLHGLENKRLSHAYLLIGNTGTPLFEVAKFLGKTLVCDHPSPLACLSCITCLRVDDDNYPDFIVIDGAKETIKKEAISTIEAQFEKKAFEKKGVMVYIINLVENMTIEAMNSLLKFLEEPQENVYAFLTTNNENSVLSTITSRCQSLYLKHVDREEVIKSSVELGIKQDDAELLSYFYNDAELIFDFLKDRNESSFYLSAKKEINELLENLLKDDKKEAIFSYQKNIIPKIKNKETMRFFIDMLVEIFEDLLNKKYGRDIFLKTYDKILSELTNLLPHINDSLVELLKQRNIINNNVNISLQLDHIILYILKE